MKKFFKTVRQRREDLRSIRERFGPLIYKERKLLFLGAFAMGVEVVSIIAMTFPLRYITDTLLMPHKRSNALWWVPEDFYLNATDDQKMQFLAIVCGALLALALIVGVAGYLRTVWCATAGQRIVMKLRKMLYGHLHYLSLRFHQDNRLGDLLVRITGDIPMLRDILSGAIVEFFGRLAMVIGFFAVLVAIAPKLALAGVGVLLLVGSLSAIFSKRIVKVVKRQRKQEGILAYTTSETLSSLTLVKALGREEEVVRRFARKNRSAMRSGLKATRLQASLSRYVEIVLAGGLALVLYLGVQRVLFGPMSPGILIQFISSLRNMNKPLRKIARISTSIGKGAACGERIDEVLRIEVEEIDNSDAVPAPPLAGTLEFCSVSFEYGRGEDLQRAEPEDEENAEAEEAPNSELDEGVTDAAVGADLNLDLELDAEEGEDASPSYPAPTDTDRGRALTELDLRIEAGEVVALVGRNGAGKSTLTNLLLRLYEPTEGEIRFDDVPARQYTIRSLRDQISIALQNTYLFGSTIKENLLFSAPEATDAEIEAVLDLVNADYIDQLPEGLETELSEGGGNLSGGQRRKLALAGALLRKTPILILDEPTAAIDQASRDDLLRALPKAIEGRTTIVIAHDVALLEGVDRVVYLEGGALIASGTHEDLQSSTAGYRALFPPAPVGKDSSR